MGEDLVDDGGRRLLAALEGLEFGSVRLTVFVRAGRLHRTEITRTESFQPAPSAEDHDPFEDPAEASHG